jgi:hypothetical protein
MKLSSKLFLPSPRATNTLLVIGFCSLGYALYIRYTALEISQVGLACAADPNTWLCFSRRVVTILHQYYVFGAAALLVAALNLLRPSLVLFAVALSIACLGAVLYNTTLSALALGLLVLSLARRAPEPD